MKAKFSHFKFVATSKFARQIVLLVFFTNLMQFVKRGRF